MKPSMHKRITKTVLTAAFLLLLMLCSSCSPQLYGRGYRKANRDCDCKKLKIISHVQADRSLDIPEPLYALDTAPTHSSRM